MGGSYERGDPYEAYETFDAIHAAGMSPIEFEGDSGEGSPLEWSHSAGAPPLVSYGASSTLRNEAGSDAIPTSVIAPGGAEPAMPVPEPSPAPQELGSPLPPEAGGAWSAERDQSTQRDERGRQQPMERREDSAMGAMAMDESRAASGATPGAEASMSGAAAGESAAPVNEWTVEEEETQTRTARIALIAGAAALSGLALAGGVTWLIIQRRRINMAREMERAIAASRLLRMTPAPARPYMLEAAQARSSAMNLAQQSAAETARMARALRQAANISASTAREYATERATTAQETLGGALNTALGGASGAWRTVARTGPGQTRWLARAFRVGRYAGRIEQRLK
jgi:hypothetical protein